MKNARKCKKTKTDALQALLHLRSGTELQRTGKKRQRISEFPFLCKKLRTLKLKNQPSVPADLAKRPQTSGHGENITGKKTTHINRAGVARTFQNIRLFKNLSVLDNVKVGLHNDYPYSTLSGILRLPSYRKQEKAMNEKAMELLKVFDLDKECDYLASNLPYGKQRKLEIARALATGPKLLLLDEPAAGMNPNETGELMETIKLIRDEFDMTILLIEHDMKLVSGICEKLTVLNFGRVLAEGETSEVLNNPEVIKAYLGD